MIRFIVILAVLAKINRQVHHIRKSLMFICKKVKEEDAFVIKTSEAMNRIERQIKGIDG